MKSALIAAAIVAAIASPVLAQGAPATPVAPSAPAVTAPAAKFTLDTPIETIVADPQGKAVLDADIPPLTTHPAFDQFKSMSLTALQPLSGGVLTDDLLKKVAADLAAIK